MITIREPKFSTSNKNRPPFREKRDDSNTPFDTKAIMPNEFSHAMVNIMLFEKGHDAVDKHHNQRKSCGLERSTKFGFTCPGSRESLIGSFRKMPRNWSYQDTILLKAFVSFCGHVQESVENPHFRLTDLSRQDFVTFVTWHATQSSCKPIFEKCLPCEELKEAIIVLK